MNIGSAKVDMADVERMTGTRAWRALVQELMRGREEMKETILKTDPADVAKIANLQGQNVVFEAFLSFPAKLEGDANFDAEKAAQAKGRK